MKVLAIIVILCIVGWAMYTEWKRGASKLPRNERECFEAWAKGKTDHFRRDKDDVYISHWTRCMWESWQAGQEEE